MMINYNADQAPIWHKKSQHKMIEQKIVRFKNMRKVQLDAGRNKNQDKHAE